MAHGDGVHVAAHVAVSASAEFILSCFCHIVIGILFIPKRQGKLKGNFRAGGQEQGFKTQEQGVR